MTIQTFINQLKESDRVWFYGFSNKLDTRQLIDVQAQLDEFTGQWQSHGKPVKGKNTIIDNTLIAITVDNHFTEASGCSIDSSVEVIKKITAKYNLDTFDRLKIAILKETGLVYLRENEVKILFDNGDLTSESKFLDETIFMGKDKAQMLKYLGESWMLKRMNIG